jgi:15,16-dihydrobiliverdin:ferredoxin oxidoreductase
MKMIESLGLKQVGLDEKFELQFSKMKQARIANMQFEGGAFRKVRMTYFDAGPNVQVFNALWMPRYEYDVPMLGVDLISLGKTRVLSVVDMQPLHPDGEYSQRYIERDEITGIRDRYPDLQGKLSGKIYDDTSFFSKNMLFGRFSDESQLKPVVHAAHDEYLTAYHNMVASATPNADPAAMAVVKERQAAYDVYSAEKDPAVGLFDAYFGKEWSEEFVHSFLFGLSKEGNSSGSDGVTKPKPKPPVHQFKFTPEGEQTPQIVGGGGSS